MIFVKHFGSTGAAIDYYGHLSRDDYFTRDMRDAPVVEGKLAEQLGIAGIIADKETFTALVKNEHPVTGEKLTQRNRDDRRSMTDFTFDVPKSASLAALQDARINDVVNDAIRETMLDMQEAAATRVRKDGKDENRITGNMMWIMWPHETARPLGDGTVDPHKHRHVTVMNMTYDDVEGKIKAIQLGDIVRDKGYYQAAYHARLAAKLTALGYGVEKDGNSFKLHGVSRELVEKFSRRTAVIEAEAEKRGITDAKKKGELGKQTRNKKGDELSTEALRQEWLKRMTPEERRSLRDARHQREKVNYKTATEAMQYAVDHSFQRVSTISEAKLKGEALRHAVGTVTPAEIDNAFLAHKELIRVTKKGERMVTTRDTLNKEIEMLAYARNGIGQYRPLGEASEHVPITLTAEQGAAVIKLLSSRDSVMTMRGAAGTGKTVTLKALVAGIERGGEGKEVIGTAVSTTAVNELKEVGINNSYTLASILNSRNAQERLKGKVLLLDEASQVSSRDMHALFKIAKEQRARVILSGDYKQHGSVDAGDAFRLLLSETGITKTELKEIRRQTVAFYKKAVVEIEKGTRAGVQKGFDLLDKEGHILELSGEERHKALVAGFLKDRDEKKTSLIVTPTHAEANRITEELRAALKERGELGKREHTYKIRKSTNWTNAEKRDARNYETGMVVQFHQNVAGIKKQTAGVVTGKDELGHVTVLMQDGKQTALPVHHASRFQVYRVEDLRIAKADQIRITQNGWLDRESGKPKRVNNGSIVTVQGFDEAGAMRLSDGTILPPTYGHFTHGYVDTSYASQGKTVDRVHIAAGSSSVLAVNSQQWYVSVSRGREKATVYVEEKEAMREAITRSGQRLAAVELVKGTEHERKIHRGWKERAKEMMERSRVYRYWRDRQEVRERGRRHER